MQSVIFLALTASLWIGTWYCGRALITLFRLAWGKSSHDRPQMLQRLGISCVIGGAGVAIGSLIPKDLGRPSPGPFIPVVWPYAPIGGWLLIFGVAIAAHKLFGLPRVLNSVEAGRNRRTILVATLVAIAGGLWLRASGGSITLLRGGIPLSWQFLVASITFAIAAIAVMIRAEQALRVRHVAKSTVMQLTLLAGAILFGVPFAWMLSTSFKEERDLGNSDGIMWIPMVQETHPYLDPDSPQYAARYAGYDVLAFLVRELPGERMLMEVERPYGLRGRQFEADSGHIKAVPRMQPIWRADLQGKSITGFTQAELDDGNKLIQVLDPPEMKGERLEFAPEDLNPVRHKGLRWENYTEALEWMPLETVYGLRYLSNTLWLVGMCVFGTVLSCSLVAYGFSRLRFPGRDALFGLLLSTMMLPAAVTMLPQFLIFRGLGWVDTLMPLWVPTFFAGAFNVFLLKQFFSTIPRELEEAARIDGAGYFRTYWQVMLPQVKPALAAVSIWTFMGAWNDFMGPLIYVSTPSKMTIAYALSLFASDRGTDIALMMAFATMTTIPVVLLFFFAQRYFIEGVQLSGLGGR